MSRYKTSAKALGTRLPTKIVNLVNSVILVNSVNLVNTVILVNYANLVKYT